MGYSFANPGLFYREYRVTITETTNNMAIVNCNVKTVTMCYQYTDCIFPTVELYLLKL